LFKEVKETLERRVTSHTILNRVIIEFLVGLLPKPEFLINQEEEKIIKRKGKDQKEIIN
jgi:hypothetical protein